MYYANLTIYSVLASFLFIQGVQGDQTKKEQKAPSAADIIEHRAEPDKADVESSQQEDYFEGSPPSGYGSFVDHKDGRLMFISGGNVWYSSDGGRTWSEPNNLNLPENIGGVNSAIRLNSGKLGVYCNGYWCVRFALFASAKADRLRLTVSSDEGETWSEPVDMNQSGSPYYDTMIQTKNGRLILPVRTTAAGHDGMYEKTSAYGTVGGERTQVEGHAQWPEMDYAWCHYSDDEGETWFRSDREIVIWKDDGYGGMWPVDEPNIIELSDGRIMMFARTTLGRIYKVFSEDGGHRWWYPEATELASSYSPCRLRRIPNTGDLICVWNQVSGDEIRNGCRRNRLSVAILSDDGSTWEHFKTIEAMPPLKPVGRIEPEEPGMVRARRELGELDPDFATVSYPNIGFHGDEVLISYQWARLHPRQGRTKLRIYPIKWFYQ